MTFDICFNCCILRAFFVFMYGVSGLRLLEINGRLMSVSPSQNASSQDTSGVLLEVDHTTKAVF